MKFAQRVVLVQTRGVPDPRVACCSLLMPVYNLNAFVNFQQLQNKNDPNLSNCPSDHPFIPAAKLEAEGQKLLEALRTMLYSSQ